MNLPKYGFFSFSPLRQRPGENFIMIIQNWRCDGTPPMMISMTASLVLNRWPLLFPFSLSMPSRLRPNSPCVIKHLAEANSPFWFLFPPLVRWSVGPSVFWLKILVMILVKIHLAVTAPLLFFYPFYPLWPFTYITEHVLWHDSRLRLVWNLLFFQSIALAHPSVFFFPLFFPR